MADPSSGENSNGRQLSMPLHNFTFPKWGAQKTLRCMKPNSNVASGSSAGGAASTGGGPNGPPVYQQPSISPPKQRRADKKVVPPMWEVDEMSHKLMNDLKVEADRMSKKVVEEDINPSRPWNLRSKRGGGSGGGLRGMMEEELFRGGGGGSSSFQPPIRPKFRRTLTKEEIEADFIAMTGAKPPKKSQSQRRPKAVQRQLDNLVPGGRLREIIIPEKYESDKGNQFKG